jgi:hypothetical protein
MALAVLLLPVVAVLLCFRPEGETLSRFRKRLFLAGAIGNALSAIALLGFLVHAYIAAHGTTPVDLDRVYPVLWMLTLGVFAAVFALFGNRRSRMFLFAGGLLTTVSWYLAALAVSP